MMIKQQAEAMLQADFNLNEEQKIAWALYRVSTLKQADDKDDIPMQKIACRQYADEHGWLLQNEVCEAGVSGYKKTAAQRDAIRLLLEAAEKGQFQILLVYMSDRIGRRGMETAMLCEKLTELGIEIWSVKEDQIKFDDDMQYLLNTIRFSMAKLESGKTSIRIKTRMEQLTLEGKYTGRKLPYGYRLVPTGEYTKKGRMRNRVEINPQEAEVVRIIFDKTIREGLGSYRLSAYLNEQGYRNQKGKPFEHNLINRTLKNRLYCGYFVWGNTVSPCLKELVIISQQDFDDAQKILAERSQKDEKKRHIALNTKGSSL